ncbi:MAG: glutamate--cysteine ligase [Planctomycetaceae bacterium]|nr:glutamate--cysteine ligase [Planctomycetaceae bacterium]
MSTLRLFEGFGIEIEYMIVRRDTLDVAPLMDALMKSVAGSYVSDYEAGAIAWSNELVNHVIEFKTNGPAKSLTGLAELFQRQVGDVNERFAAMNARLMPGAMHPWMDPFKETKLWEHDSNEVYDAFNRIFNCRGHGWSNLQSMHINLPFGDDKEFGKLHAAIRLVLPILPALAASSPVMDGKVTGTLDNRLEVYRTNSARIPSITADVVPEPVFTQKEYEHKILERIYNDLKPYDPEGVLRYEFSNARGAIARFDRNAIEIRVLDVQESPLADLATASLVIGAVRALVEERTASTTVQQAWQTAALKDIFLECVKMGDKATINNPSYLKVWGVEAPAMEAGELWRHLSKYAEPAGDAVRKAAELKLEHGTLASRIIRALGGAPNKSRLREVYGALSDCLNNGSLFGL